MRPILRLMCQEDAQCYALADVYAVVNSSLNGRDPQRLIDPEIDLVKVPRSLRHSDWIQPLQEPL